MAVVFLRHVGLHVVLVLLATTSPTWCSCCDCGQLLRFLLVDSAGGLREAIHLLDPLPRVSVFSDARKICTKLKYNKGPFSLLQEINRFLLVSERGEEGVGAIAEGRLEGLLFLQHQLSTSKDQLPHLVTQVKEQSLVSPLVSLVYKLIQLSQSPHERVAQEAGRCLAEIGPTDLQIVAIKGQCCKVALSAALSLYDHDQRLQQYCKIFHLLDDYLNDSSIQVVCAASQVLKAMLATKTGMSFHQGYKGHVKDSLFQYLHPFKPARKKVMPMLDVDVSEDNFVNTVDDDSLWVPHNTNHPTWVTQLVCQLIRSRGVHDELLCLLTPVCQVKAKLCEVVLPFLVHDILLNGSKKHTDVLSRQIGRFFEQHCGMLEKMSSRPVTLHTHTDSQEGESICTNKASMQVMLNVIQYLRLQERQLTGPTRPTPWDNNWWLDVDYLQVAKAAQSCSAYFTTLLYSEIWCDTHRDSDKSSSPPSSRDKQNSPLVSSQSSQLETLSALSDEGNINVQELMLEAYHSIGDPDGIYGCGAGRLADTVARIQTYEHENDWSKALCSYDLQFSQPTASVDQANLLQALQNFGTSHVLDMYLLGLSSQSDISSSEVQDFQYHAACRNANWNIKVPVRLEPTCSYDKAVYTGLRALHETDTTTAMAAFKLARDATLRSLGAISMESARSLYPLLSKLQCITELEDLTSCVTGGGHQLDPSRFDHTLHKWSVQSNIVHNDYKFIEPIISQRCVLLQLLLDQSPADTDRVMDGLLTQLCQLARLARDAGRYQVAERAVHQLHHLAGAMVDESWEWRIEEARMFWARGEHITAKYLMRTIIDKLEKGRINLGTFYPKCLGIYGDWLAETCSEAPNTIMEKYLQKAVTLLEEHGSADRAVLDAFLSLARYADGQYQHIIEYMHCGSFEAKQLLIRQAKEEVNQLKSVGEKSSRYLRTLEKQRQLDEQELESMMTDRGHFLSCALSNYLKCLKFGDRHDMRVFRVTSLWFDNASQPEINESIQRGTEQIKSCKFLPLMYQLAARMGVAQPHSPSQFYPTLNSLIERVVLEHPYHTLFIILALANANKDNYMVSERSSSWRSRLTKNKSSSEEEPETQQTTEEDDYPILREEVEAAVKSLKKGKSAGIDNIPAELVQAGGEALIITLTTICNKIWQTGEWPTPWTQSLIITLPKKGNLQMCQNYRTISLISHPSKVMLKILLNRLKPQAEEIIAEEQAGFRAGRSTIEQIFNLRILCEKHLQHQQILYHVFIDFKKAFDKVWHAALWATMRKYNIGSKLVRTIEHLYDNATSAVTFNSSIGDWFRTTVGVRQGCLLSPTLFNIFLERIMTDALENHQGTVSIGGRTITNLRFADDIDGLAGDEQELVNLVERLEKTSSSYGMEISAEKTKLMTNSTQGISTEVKVNGQRLEAVTSFRYLGSIITDEGSKPEIPARIAQTTAALTRLKPLWNDRNITVSSKIRLMRSLVMSIFLYACETWTLSADLQKRIQAMEMRCFRKILHISYKDHVTNDAVRCKIKQAIGPYDDLLTTVKKRKLKWYGHVSRSSGLAKTILQGTVRGGRRRGRQKKRWEDNIKEWTGMEFADSQRAVENRETWRELGRMQAAVNMIESLRQSRRAGIIQDMEKLCEAYIQLANWDVSQYKNETKAIKLPSWMWLTKLNDLETIAIPTLTTKVSKCSVLCVVKQWY
ncbi:Serine-protein kinase ATM [Lamellibrachia satsuma]|nr:Serine-protein kinase ATM [Lamellibrachia satsuma]